MTPRATWLSFATVSTIILLAAGFLGCTVWQQDEREQRAGTLALWEQKVQAALWRMDAAASAMVAREAARRPEEFVALAQGGSALADRESQGRPKPTRPPGNAALQGRSEGLKKNDAPAHDGGRASPRSQGSRLAGASASAPAAASPAPMATATPRSETAKLAPAQDYGRNSYFSEKVALPPVKAKQAHAAKTDAKREAKTAAAEAAPLADLAKQLPAPATVTARADRAEPRFVTGKDQGAAGNANRAEAQIEAQMLNSFAQRQAANNAIYNNLQARDQTAGTRQNLEAQAAIGTLTAVAEDGNLVLARRVETRGGEIVQGVRLDIATVAGELLALVRADFPKGQLLPEYANPPKNLARTLAALPLRFEPNEQPQWVIGWTPTRTAVTTAGCALLVALGAVALLLARTLALSERRATFVSTMTHELRTPLTTFRLYTDLLEAAPEIADRARYTQVLAREAERLSHLVENVLSYARLERGRSKPAPKAQTVAALLAPALDRLRERAQRAGFTLEVAPYNEAQMVKADAATVEQILLNLVDNAGKYAQSASDKRLVLKTDAAARRATAPTRRAAVPAFEIALRDFGPGLDPAMEKRLFSPFSRSDKEAAGNAPGVGLGLALCRRLAREMGGDLVYKKAEPGAEFALVLGK